MSERKKSEIIHFQSECLVEYSKYAKITTMESSELFKKYNLFEFISECYDVLHLDSVEYVVKYDIAKRIKEQIVFNQIKINMLTGIKWLASV